MKQIVKLSSCLLIAIIMLSGCCKATSDEDLFSYKGSYVGDASKVGNILNRLPVAGYSKGFELQTDEEPYGIILNYDGSESEAEQEEIVVYTATYLFTLVQNVDWITYNFNNQEYQLTKVNLQRWYGEDFIDLQNEHELQILAKKYLNDENKVKQLLLDNKIISNLQIQFNKNQLYLVNKMYYGYRKQSFVPKLIVKETV